MRKRLLRGRFAYDPTVVPGGVALSYERSTPLGLPRTPLPSAAVASVERQRGKREGRVPRSLSAPGGGTHRALHVQGCLAHKKHPPVGPYSSPLPMELGRS
jgi:hypothetical protein